MKTAFILLAIITASILYGYPAYQLYQAEKHARLSFKQIPNNAIAHKLNMIGGQRARSELLNQYPSFIVYIMLNDYESDEIPEGSIEKLHQISCENLDSLKRADTIFRKATLNITEKDQINFKFFIKNKFGKELLQHQQIVAECPNFNALKTYQPPEDDSTAYYNPPPMSPMKVAELEAKERKLSNGY